MQFLIFFINVNFLYKKEVYAPFLELFLHLLFLNCLQLKMMPDAERRIGGGCSVALSSLLGAQLGLPSRNASCVLGQGPRGWHFPVLLYWVPNSRHVFFSYL